MIAQAGPRAKDLDAPRSRSRPHADDRKAMELVMSGTRLGRPLAMTPDVPADRLAALRTAFRATMADPEFRAEAATANFEVNPVFGEDMQRTVGEIMATPKPIAERVKHLVQVNDASGIAAAKNSGRAVWRGQYGCWPRSRWRSPQARRSAPPRRRPIRTRPGHAGGAVPGRRRQ